MRCSKPLQTGQALVLCLVMMFVGAIGAYFMFSTAQVSSTRHRLDNAADAAAWSAALWRARVMNYHAYANRAIIAQEVAIAQAVTLASWAKYFDTFSTTASVLAAPYPPVAAVLAVVEKLKERKRKANVAFAFWSGEEMGLLGSGAFVASETIEPDSIIAYVNFDMVGRMRDNKLEIGRAHV